LAWQRPPGTAHQQASDWGNDRYPTKQTPPISELQIRKEGHAHWNGEHFATYFSLDVKFYREFRIPFLGSSHGKTHHVRLGFYSLNVTNHGNFNAVFNNVTAPNFGQFAGFLDRRDGAMIDFVD